MGLPAKNILVSNESNREDKQPIPGAAKASRLLCAIIAIGLFLVSAGVRFYKISDPPIQGDELLWLDRSEGVHDRWVKGDYHNLTTHLKHPGLPEAVSMAFAIEIAARINKFRGIAENKPGAIKEFQAARGINAAVSALVCPALFLLATPLIGAGVAALASFMLALEPFHIANSQMVHVDTMLCLFVTLTSLFYLHAVEKKSAALKLLSGFCWGLCISTKVTSGCLIVIFIAYKFVRNLLIPASLDRGERSLVSWSDLWAVIVAHLFLGLTYTRMWLHLDKHLGRHLVHSSLADLVYRLGNALAATPQSILALLACSLGFAAVAYLRLRRNEVNDRGWQLVMVGLLVSTLGFLSSLAPQVPENFVRFWTFAASLRNEVPFDVGRWWHNPKYSYFELYFRKLPPWIFIGLVGGYVLSSGVFIRTIHTRITDRGTTALTSRFSRRDTAITFLAIFIAVWTLPLCLSSKQDYRYIIPALPCIYLLATICLSESYQFVSGYLSRSFKVQERSLVSGFYLALAGCSILLLALVRPHYFNYFSSWSGGFADAKKKNLRFTYMGYPEAIDFLHKSAEAEGILREVKVLGAIADTPRLSYPRYLAGRKPWVSFSTQYSEAAFDYLLLMGVHRENVAYTEGLYAAYGNPIPIYSYYHDGAEVLRIYKQTHRDYLRPLNFDIEAIHPLVGHRERADKLFADSRQFGAHRVISVIPGRDKAGHLMASFQLRLVPGSYLLKLQLGIPDLEQSPVQSPVSVPADTEVLQLGILGKLQTITYAKFVIGKELWAELPFELSEADGPTATAFWTGKVPLVLSAVTIERKEKSPPAR